MRRVPLQRRAALAPAALLAALCALPHGTLSAQTVYKQRDASGQWVYTDGAASPAAPPGATVSRTRENEGAEGLRISLERVDSEDFVQLVGTNHCLCVITLRVTIAQSGFADLPSGARYLAKLAPGARQTVVQARRPEGANAQLRYSWTVALGSPDAVHNPPRPYRAPFALGATFTVSQAFPVRITHTSPDSAYAVDIALPDGTPVYAARGGTVINVRHDSFRGAALPEMLDQANVIEILHDDGTIALYAHLQWDSIRVRIGQHVQVGEYIANSGNTGFTTGPHLHFAVWRNAGAADVSIPIEFAGPGGSAVTPETNMPLTAY